jgi:alanyl-tRNA synthetase
MVKQQLKELKPENVNGTDLYTGRFSGADRKVLTDAAEGFKSKGGVVAFVSVADTVSVMIASGSPKVDCKKLLPEVLGKFGGRGGGKPDFAQGGVQDVSLADEVYKVLAESVRNLL